LAKAEAVADASSTSGVVQRINRHPIQTIQAEDGMSLWLCPKCGWGQENPKMELVPACERCTAAADHEEQDRRGGGAVVLPARGVFSGLMAGLTQGCAERQCKPAK